MVRYKTEYKHLGYVEGEFSSNFTTRVAKTSDQAVYSDIEFTTNTELRNARLINNIPVRDKAGKELKAERLEMVPIYCQKGEKKPLEQDKRMHLQEVLVREPVIELSEKHKGGTRGKISGIAYAELVEPVRVLVREKLKAKVPVPIKTIKEETADEPIVAAVDEEFVDVEPTVPAENGGCLNRYLPGNQSNPNAGVGASDPNSTGGINGPAGGCGSQVGGCGSQMGGCGSGMGGCNQLAGMGTGCQRLGCGLFSLLAALALLLLLLRQCDTILPGDSDQNEEPEVVTDTVRVVETDTVNVETVVLDTIMTTDTLTITDTTIIKDVMPTPFVYFKTNSAVIRHTSVKGLKDLGEYLKKHKELNLVIAGHTDEQGNAEHNDTLSFCRAKSVVSILLDSSGIAPDRLTYEGYGENCPKESDGTAESRVANRRVEFRMVDEPARCEEFKILLADGVCETKSFKVGIDRSSEPPKFVEKLASVNRKCRMYAKPNKKTPKHLLSPQDTITIRSSDGNWCKITDHYGRDGYIKRSKLTLLENRQKNKK